MAEGLKIFTCLSTTIPTLVEVQVFHILVVSPANLVAKNSLAVKSIHSINISGIITSTI